MKENNEIKEIMAFIEAAELSGTAEPALCVDRITADIDELFLTNRAEVVREHFELNDKFKNVLGHLASICNSDNMKCDICPVNKYCNTYIKAARTDKPSDALSMIDMFCGAGGLSLGFKQEGFFTCLANDIQECCVDTYAHNHPETPRKKIVLGDIKDVVEKLDELLEGEQPDIVVGGPPCQGFSMANRQRLIDDPRNHLYKNFIQVVKKANPKFFVMENVKGMLSVKDQVLEDFSKIGYAATAYILNAKDFGVPQNRERLIFIGNRIGIDTEKVFNEIFALRESIPDTYLKDALYGLRPLKALRVKNSTEIDTEESGRKIEANRIGETNAYIDYINQGKTINIVCNHKARYNNDRDIEIFGRLYPGDKSDDPKIADIMPYTSRKDIFKDKYYKLDGERVSKTITAHMKFDCNMYIHPNQARGLTPREAARVQSYPDDYFFRGAYTKTYMQIGNSVPPILGRAIAVVVKKYINN